MGIDISSAKIVGLPYDQFIEKCEHSQRLLHDNAEDAQELIDHLLDDGELDYASPWYDSSRDNWVIGYNVSDWDISVEEFVKELSETKERFIKDFGFEPKVFVSAHVY